jgi:hypothetical protein
MAIRTLVSTPPPVPLRVAYPVAPSSLPIILLKVFPEHQTPPVPLPAINIQTIEIPTGLEALNKLTTGEADVAVCYRYSRSDKETSNPASRCVRISSFCRQFVHGLGIKSDFRISTRHQLRTTRFGYPLSSGIGLFLEDIVPFESFGNYAPKAFENPAQAARMLIEGKIHYVLALQPILAKVKAEMDNEYPKAVLEPFPSSLLPPANFDLFVNKATPNPSAVLTLLDSLNKVINNLTLFLDELPEAQKSSLAHDLGYPNFAKLKSMVQVSSIPNEAPGCDFSLDAFLNLDGILTFWRRTTAAR